MEKLQLSQILVKDAVLRPEKLDTSSEKIIDFIKTTIIKQQEILKLKNIDQDTLRMVVQM